MAGKTASTDRHSRHPDGSESQTGSAGQTVTKVFFFFGILLYSLLLFYILLKPNAGEKGISNDKYTIKKIEFNHVPVSCAVIFVDRCGWQLLTDIPNTATHPVLCHHFRTWMHLPKDTVTSRFKHNADVENAF